MKLLNIFKNVALSLSMTMLYAIWCKESLHNESPIKMWVILILVWALILHLLVWVDREVRRIQRERSKKCKK